LIRGFFCYEGVVALMLTARLAGAHASIRLPRRRWHERRRHRVLPVVELRGIDFVEPGQIGPDPAIEARNLLRDGLAPGDLLAVCDGAKLRAVHDDQPGREQARIPA